MKRKNELKNEGDKRIKSEEELEEKRIENVTRIYENVNSGNFSRLIDKVAFILNFYPNARNSDVELAYNFWSHFENDIYQDGNINKYKMFNLTKITSLTRARAKIQNEYKIFLADLEIRKSRRRLRDAFSDESIQDKPHEYSYQVYADESGKNEQYLIVGSIWLFSFGPTMLKKQQELFQWKKDNNINYEFHFKDLKNNSLNNYKRFVEKFIGLNPDIGFKAIVVERKGIADVYGAIEDLTTHLIFQGVNQENNSGRAPLPRNIMLTVDKDEVGKDLIKMENIKERLRAQNIEGLRLLNFTPEDSLKNEYLQMTDLVTASLNRIINFPDKQTAKDEFARHLLSLLKVDLEVFKTENYNKSLVQPDNSVVISLK
uniref:DUF3800 domain-containing protein n=1 Tax=Sphingobacterium sp. (strain 21) TaxID=743722 RepID=F4C9R7_SPHS2